MKAFRQGNKDAITVLIHAGADPNIIDVDEVQKIINHGIYVDSTDKEIVIALMI